MNRNIDTEGRTYDFGQRDAMHYVVYDLEPLLMAASIAVAHGENWFGAPSLTGSRPRCNGSSHTLQAKSSTRNSCIAQSDSMRGELRHM